MKAAVFREAGRPLAIEEIPTPTPGAGEALVKVAGCGMCHTDLHYLDHGVKPFKTPPLVLGHEIAGTVARAGAGVGRFREGDRVALHHHVPCGSCFYCGERLYAQCQGYKRNGTSAGFEPAGGGYASTSVNSSPP